MRGISAGLFFLAPAALGAQSPMPVTYENPPLPPAPPPQSIMPKLSPDGTTPAKPINNVWQWATTDDYPPLALRLQLEGRTGARLTISPTGSVTGCSLVESSGVQLLDEITCALMAKRARFSPALDANDKPMVGDHHRGILWLIPRDDGDAPYQSVLAPTPLSDPASWVSPNIWMDTKNYTLRPNEAYQKTIRLYRLTVDREGAIAKCEAINQGRLFHPKTRDRDKAVCSEYEKPGRFDRIVNADGTLPKSDKFSPPAPDPKLFFVQERIYIAHIPAQMLILKEKR
jgi:TonB family protein